MYGTLFMFLGGGFLLPIHDMTRYQNFIDGRSGLSRMGKDEFSYIFKTSS